VTPADHRSQLVAGSDSSAAIPTELLYDPPPDLSSLVLARALRAKAAKRLRGLLASIAPVADSELICPVCGASAVARLSA
jgi:hypothetical protein